MEMPSEEPQPQVITSADKKYQIISHGKAYRDGFGSYTVEGVVKNVSSEPEIDARIKIDYYDIDRVKVDTELDTVTVLRPGGTRGFYIPYSGRRRGEVKHHWLSLCD